MYGKTRLGFIKLVRTNAIEKNVGKNEQTKGAEKRKRNID